MSTTTAPHSQAHHTASPMPPAPPKPARLGRYTDDHTGTAREIIRIAGPEESTLVIDRLTRTGADPRLVAHLAADEPPQNARVLTSMYLADPSRGRCRPVSTQDLIEVPSVGFPAATETCVEQPDTPLFDAEGARYGIREVPTSGPLPELRWTCSHDPRENERFETLTLREVVGRLQDYEPTRTITARTLAARRGDPLVSTCRLREDLARLGASSIVLNRGLREAVMRRVKRGEASMSEIAMRCGRFKQGGRGELYGETSWLGRRIGRLPEGGEHEPTPWIQSDVLALIVREGLRACPHEVEL